ncbi:MAG TPA: hypothetical protein VGI20_13190 [Rhizomicrobium sp.]|jgi:hypothetical protein
MLLDGSGIPDSATAQGYERLETGEFIAVWTGFLFVRGCIAGNDSVAVLLESLRREGAEKALARPKGSFALCIFDKRTRDTICAIDPFGLMRLFVGAGFVSDDLFASIRRLGKADDHLDIPALAGFLRFGFYDFWRTFDTRVRFLAGNEIAMVSPGRDIVFRQKALPDFRANPHAFDFDAYVRDVRRAIEARTVSLDLTGGYDSRLLAACLKNAGIRECATTGQSGNLDVEIARRVASALKLPHLVSKHDVSGLEERAWTLVHLTHGQMGMLTYDHIYQFTRERQARGIDLCIVGNGGELWKDILWLQDFPFLTGPPDFKRLFRTRLEPRAVPDLPLTPSFARAFAAGRNSRIEEMREQFGALPRTMAYDCVYAFRRIPFTSGPSVTAGIRSGLPPFCPLFDFDGAVASFHKPVRERLFSRWHRETIARYAPEIAKLRTDDGLSARKGLSALGDLPFYASNKILRLTQKIVQRLGLPDVRHLSLDDPRTLEMARILGVAQPAMQRLRTANVLTGDSPTEQFSRALFDRLLTSGMCLAEVSN